MRGTLGLDRIVAIKILPPEMSRDPLRRQRFEREAKTISNLNHPNICVLYDVGSQDGVSYLVMECLEGETLEKRLEKGPLPTEALLRYGMEIADALEKAHRNGVIHRDLKPGKRCRCGRPAVHRRLRTWSAECRNHAGGKGRGAEEEVSPTM